MRDRDEIIEAMARGAYAENDWWRTLAHDDDGKGRYQELDGLRMRAVEWAELDADDRALRLKEASAALTALEAEGMAVVPVEPTEAMQDSGGSSIIRPSIYMGGTPPGAKRRARDVWAAMLAAHTQEKDA